MGATASLSLAQANHWWTTLTVYWLNMVPWVQKNCETYNRGEGLQFITRKSTEENLKILREPIYYYPLLHIFILHFVVCITHFVVCITYLIWHQRSQWSNTKLTCRTSIALHWLSSNFWWPHIDGTVAFNSERGIFILLIDWLEMSWFLLVFKNSLSQTISSNLKILREYLHNLISI